ncbi:molybdopterin-dependent oxidoreductase [Paracoccus sp. EF6]|uniref:Molybdopterin-dependent oxidoreductase n=2 Tax=Paracoccus benzoatiresistens TaxID=2997341 RepID=A0ABT4J9D9_9RHOB|nr:nitrate reductase [Paracoccus sp. EF6]MCZ0963756.1 molybdopterin-dependent oxidoreductase [Paracoccus sp. EF6]
MQTPGPAIRTTCPYCGVGCGILATPDGAGGLAIAGDPDHPANFGRLCVKGSALGETVGMKGRLLAPQIGGREAGWDEALDLVARRLSETIAEHGPDAVAFYVSGQLLTEDYYVANKLMKGFIGSANIDTNSRLCMASSVAGHRRAFGSDTVPGLYEDLEQADCVVLVGSNLAWCHPVLFQRLAAAREARGTKVVVIDPRRTATCDIADLHLALAPGSDGVLFNLLLAEIERRGLVAATPENLVEALAAARAMGPAATGLADGALRQFLDVWCGSNRVVTVYSQGVNQSDSGTDKVNAILNCHLATGRIGRPGMGPFSVTGQPNAMGGREVGGLANMLACHLDIENGGHRAAVQDFWRAPRMAERPGLKAVDMFRAVGDGRIKALWIICTNPAVSMPEADRVARAIAGCDFVVVSDMMARTDTTRLAHVLLPATGWAEKDGTVTNSERRISRQRRSLVPAGQARDDWRIIADVAARMGWPEAFAWDSPAQVFAEHAALSGLAGRLGGAFDISAHAGITAAQYGALEPFLWPQSSRRSGGRFFGDGRFHTPSGRARMVPVVPRLPQPVGPAHPFRLNTGRVRDHWHTMTRTGLSPRLSRHLAEPFLELHPTDAARLGLAPAALAEVSSPHGRAILRVLVTDRVAPGHPFAPIHWTGETAPTGRIGALVVGLPDPLSGQPASKSTPVAIRPFGATWYGFAVSARPITPDCDYWVRAILPGGHQAELAGLGEPADWPGTARTMLGVTGEPLVVRDAGKGILRMAFVADGRLQAALFISPEPAALSRSHVIASLGASCGGDVLAGRPGAQQSEAGALVCACLGVGMNTILQGIATRKLMTVEAIGKALGAGTNCGSCKPELKALIEAAKTQARRREVDA